MDGDVSDDQMSRYIRRIQLGIRFLGHGARANTTCQWTSLTPDQLVTVRRRSRFSTSERLRGPSPSSFATFFRSNRTRGQAALFLSICQVVGPTRSTRSVENGEKLCEAFEVFREWEPESDFDFEQAVLLMDGAGCGVSLAFVNCSSCSCPLVVDTLGDTQDVCHWCRRGSTKMIATA